MAHLFERVDLGREKRSIIHDKQVFLVSLLRFQPMSDYDHRALANRPLLSETFGKARPLQISMDSPSGS
jgi:hypothetical protein